MPSACTIASLDFLVPIRSGGDGGGGSGGVEVESSAMVMAGLVVSGINGLGRVK